LFELTPPILFSEPQSLQHARDNIMKAATTKPAATPQTDVFPKTLHRLRPRLAAATVNPKTPKRDNVFSKSRDTREDRGARQMKTKSNPQTFTHGK
jgi:hypothetical protein